MPTGAAMVAGVAAVAMVAGAAMVVMVAMVATAATVAMVAMVAGAVIAVLGITLLKKLILQLQQRLKLMDIALQIALIIVSMHQSQSSIKTSNDIKTFAMKKRSFAMRKLDDNRSVLKH